MSEIRTTRLHELDVGGNRVLRLIREDGADSPVLLTTAFSGDGLWPLAPNCVRVPAAIVAKLIDALRELVQ